MVLPSHFLQSSQTATHYFLSFFKNNLQVCCSYIFIFLNNIFLNQLFSEHCLAMESRFWDNYDDSDFMEINLDYPFETGISGSTGNDQALIVEAARSPALKEPVVKSFRREDKSTSNKGVDSVENSDTPLDSVQQTYPEENVAADEESTEGGLASDSTEEESMSSGELETMHVNKNANLWADDNSVKVIQGVMQSTDFVPRGNAKQSLPNWDELKNPFRYEKPVELQIDNLNYYANYVKLVTNDSSTIYFKLLNNPNVCDMKSAALTLKFNKVLWYYCAYTEINISQQMEWNWHQNFPDSSSLFLVFPKQK